MNEHFAIQFWLGLVTRQMIDGFSKSQAYWLTEWLIEWLPDWLTEWLNAWLTVACFVRLPNSNRNRGTIAPNSKLKLKLKLKFALKLKLKLKLKLASWSRGCSWSWSWSWDWPRCSRHVCSHFDCNFFSFASSRCFFLSRGAFSRCLH